MIKESLSTQDRLAYFQRLIKPYTKNKEKKFFIDQYIRGDGNELESKFWSLRSSSRFAFEMYSWMAKDNQILDFEFEKKLPGMKSGGNGPNMDVFVETKDELIFIESKFSEVPSIAYADIQSDKHHLSPAYWLDGIHGKLNLKSRYNEHEEAFAFRDFIMEMDEQMQHVRENGIPDGEWFDVKQETCHLIGIFLYLKLHPTSKKVRLYNIFWKLDKDYSVIEERFTDLLRKYKDKIFKGIDFEYYTFSAQDVITNEVSISPYIHFPSVDVQKSVSAFEIYARGETRKGMQKKIAYI